MRILRGLAGALLWIGGGLLGLLSVLLCVTIILLPLGIPLLGLARRMMAAAVRLMLPRAVAHPVKESRKGLRKRSGDAGDTASKAASAVGEGGRRGKKNAKAAAEEIGKKTKRKRKPWWKRSPEAIGAPCLGTAERPHPFPGGRKGEAVARIGQSPESRSWPK